MPNEVRRKNTHRSLQTERQWREKKCLFDIKCERTKKKLVGSISVWYETNAISCFAWAHQGLQLQLIPEFLFHSVRAPAHRVSNRKLNCKLSRKLLGLYGYGTRPHQGNLLFARRISNDFYMYFVNIPVLRISAIGFCLLFSIQFEVATVTTTISNALISCDLKIEKSPHGKRV